jgi:plastocyanin
VSRRAPTAAAATVAALLAASPAGTGLLEDPYALAGVPARLLVAADEFSFVLSRERIAPGRAQIQLLNRGEDDHDLRLRRISRRPNRPIAKWKLTRPGELSELTLRVSRGRYRLWCSLPGHRKLGMRATLRVSRPR